MQVQHPKIAAIWAPCGGIAEEVVLEIANPRSQPMWKTRDFHRVAAGHWDGTVICKAPDEKKGLARCDYANSRQTLLRGGVIGYRLSLYIGTEEPRVRHLRLHDVKGLTSWSYRLIGGAIPIGSDLPDSRIRQVANEIVANMIHGVEPQNGRRVSRSNRRRKELRRKIRGSFCGAWRL